MLNREQLKEKYAELCPEKTASMLETFMATLNGKIAGINVVVKSESYASQTMEERESILSGYLSAAKSACDYVNMCKMYDYIDYLATIQDPWSEYLSTEKGRVIDGYKVDGKDGTYKLSDTKIDVDGYAVVMTLCGAETVNIETDAIIFANNICKMIAQDSGARMTKKSLSSAHMTRAAAMHWDYDIKTLSYNKLSQQLTTIAMEIAGKVAPAKMMSCDVKYIQQTLIGTSDRYNARDNQRVAKFVLRNESTIINAIVTAIYMQKNNLVYGFSAQCNGFVDATVTATTATAKKAPAKKAAAATESK